MKNVDARAEFGSSHLHCPTILCSAWNCTITQTQKRRTMTDLHSALLQFFVDVHCGCEKCADVDSLLLSTHNCDKTETKTNHSMAAAALKLRDGSCEYVCGNWVKFKFIFGRLVFSGREEVRLCCFDFYLAALSFVRVIFTESNRQIIKSASRLKRIRRKMF